MAIYTAFLQESGGSGALSPQVDQYIDRHSSESRRNSALLPRKGAVDSRSPLSTNMSPRARHGESGQPRSGASTPVQSAPPAPSMMPNNSSTATRSSSPTLVIMQSLDDLNNKMNYVKAQQSLRHLRQHGEDGPVTMASLHKMRANKEASYKADIETYKRIIENGTMTGPVLNAIKGSGTDQSSGSPSTQGAEVKALKIETKKLQHDQKMMADKMKRLDDDRKLWEAQREKDVQQHIDAAVTQKVQEEIQVQLKAFFDANIKPTIDEQRTALAADFRQQISDGNKKVQSLSSEVSALQTSHKSIFDQVDKVNATHIKNNNHLSSQVKAIDKRCDHFLRPDSLDITNLATKISNQNSNLENLVKESAAKNAKSQISQIEDYFAKAVSPINERLDVLEPSVDKKLQQIDQTSEKQVGLANKRIDLLMADFTKERDQTLQEKVDRATQDGTRNLIRTDADNKAINIAVKGLQEEINRELSNLGTRISIVDKAQDRTVRQDLFEELSTLKGRFSVIESRRTEFQDQKDIVERLLSLETKTSSFEAARANLMNLERRVADFESSQNKTIRTSIVPTKGKPSDTLQLSDDGMKKISNLEARMSTLENGPPSQMSAQFSALNNLFEGVHSDIGDVELAIHDCKTDIDALKVEIPKMFSNNQTRTEEQSQKMNNIISTHGEKIEKLEITISTQGGDREKLHTTQSSHRRDIQNLQATQESHEHTITELQNVQSIFEGEITKLQSFTKSQINTLSGDFQEVRQKVNTMKSTSDAEGIQKLQGQLDIIKQAHQSLEHRYENINTAELHNMMVQQMQQMYPSAPAFLDQLRVNQTQIQDLGQRARRIEQHFDPKTGDFHQARQNIQDLTETVHIIRANVRALQVDLQALQTISDLVIVLRGNIAAWEEKMEAKLSNSSSNSDIIFKDIQLALQKEMGDRTQAVSALHRSLADIESNLDKGVLEINVKADKISDRVSEVECSSLEINKRLPDMDQLIKSKVRIIEVAGVCPIILARQDKLVGYLETLNEKLGVPVQRMNLDQLRVDPFEPKPSG